VTADLTRLKAHEMADRLRAGEVTSRELTEAHLDAAEAGNHALNAWLTVDRDEALRTPLMRVSGPVSPTRTPCWGSRSRSRT
jgi:Asp-tRNA(Asn)/Glu-tRNA(Gln) amidotransferase A subunit family amidase